MLKEGDKERNEKKKKALFVSKVRNQVRGHTNGSNAWLVAFDHSAERGMMRIRRPRFLVPGGQMKPVLFPGN